MVHDVYLFSELKVLSFKIFIFVPHRSMAERSYLSPKVRDGDREYQAAMA